MPEDSAPTQGPERFSVATLNCEPAADMELSEQARALWLTSLHIPIRRLGKFEELDRLVSEQQTWFFDGTWVQNLVDRPARFFELAERYVTITTGKAPKPELTLGHLMQAFLAINKNSMDARSMFSRDCDPSSFPEHTVFTTACTLGPHRAYMVDNTREWFYHVGRADAYVFHQRIADFPIPRRAATLGDDSETFVISPLGIDATMFEQRTAYTLCFYLLYIFDQVMLPIHCQLHAAERRNTVRIPDMPFWDILLLQNVQPWQTIRMGRHQRRFGGDPAKELNTAIVLNLPPSRKGEVTEVNTRQVRKQFRWIKAITAVHLRTNTEEMGIISLMIKRTASVVGLRWGDRLMRLTTVLFPDMSMRVIVGLDANEALETSTDAALPTYFKTSTYYGPEVMHGREEARVSNYIMLRSDGAFRVLLDGVAIDWGHSKPYVWHKNTSDVKRANGYAFAHGLMSASLSFR